MVVEVGGEKKLRRILPFWCCCGPGTGDLAKGSEAFNNPLAQRGEVSGDCPAAALWWATLKHWADERRARAGCSLHPARACPAAPRSLSGPLCRSPPFLAAAATAGFHPHVLLMFGVFACMYLSLHMSCACKVARERGVVVLFVLLRHFLSNLLSLTHQKKA